MRGIRIANALLVAGVTVGALAAVGWMVDYVPDLPRAVLKILLYKLALGAGVGLVFAGAMVRRYVRRSSARVPVPR